MTHSHPDEPAARNARLAFIGGGQMARALINGLTASGWPPSCLTVVEPNADQRGRLSQDFGVRTTDRPGTVLASADVVVWAVKPQMLHQAVDGARSSLGEALHVSIAAGVSSTDLGLWLGSDRIVRVMPNTSALVGAGVSGMFARAAVSTEDRALAARVMAATGYCFWVDSDERLDAVTAVSGSGPAYVFKFLECFQAAATGLGFSAAMARDLVLMIMAGAVKQAQADDSAFSTLRERVTSKGGTTEAALDVLERARFMETIEAAVHAAFERARALSRAGSTQS